MSCKSDDSLRTLQSKLSPPGAMPPCSITACEGSWLHQVLLTLAWNAGPRLPAQTFMTRVAFFTSMGNWSVSHPRSVEPVLESMDPSIPNLVRRSHRKIIISYRHPQGNHNQCCHNYRITTYPSLGNLHC